MKRDRPRALLLDFDGVLRRFDEAHPTAVELQYGLPAGALLTTAFEGSRLRPVLVGEHTHAHWLAVIGTTLAESHDIDPAVAAGAVVQWQTDRGTVVPEVLSLVHELRAAGVPVGLATNATDLLTTDLDALGLVGAFDAVINSSAVGAHKPSPAFFAAACQAIGAPPAACLFVDDDDRNVRGARAAGLSAHRWAGPADLRYLRAALLGA